MPLTQTKEQEIVGYAAEKNLAIEKDALELLVKADDFRKVINEILIENTNTLFLGVKEIEQRLIKTIMPQVEARVTVEGNAFKPEARGMPKKLRILKEYDVTNQSCSEGTVKNFLELFQGKFPWDNLYN